MAARRMSRNIQIIGQNVINIGTDLYERELNYYLDIICRHKNKLLSTQRKLFNPIIILFIYHTCIQELKVPQI